MLFVRGNAADRIVGYNDDAPSDVLDEFGLDSTTLICVKCIR